MHAINDPHEGADRKRKNIFLTTVLFFLDDMFVSSTYTTSISLFPHLNDNVTLPGLKFVCFFSGFVKVKLYSSCNSSCWVTNLIVMVCKQDLT